MRRRHEHDAALAAALGQLLCLVEAQVAGPQTVAPLLRARSIEMLDVEELRLENVGTRFRGEIDEIERQLQITKMRNTSLGDDQDRRALADLARANAEAPAKARASLVRF